MSEKGHAFQFNFPSALIGFAEKWLNILVIIRLILLNILFAVPTKLDLILHNTSVSNWFYYVVTIALTLLKDRLICIELLMHFDLNHSSVHLWGMYAVKTTLVLANHNSACLLLSLQSTTHVQTGLSDEGVKNRTENSLLLLFYDVCNVKFLITL